MSDVRRSCPPDEESLALFRAYVGNLTEHQLRACLKLRAPFEDWAVRVYREALAKKLEGKRGLFRQQQFERQIGATRDKNGRYTGRSKTTVLYNTRHSGTT